MQPFTQQILVQNINGKTFCIDISPKESVLTLKEYINDVAGVPTEHQTIIYQNKILSNNEYLISDYNISELSTIYLFTKLKSKIAQNIFETNQIIIKCGNDIWKIFNNCNINNDKIDITMNNNNNTIILDDVCVKDDNDITFLTLIKYYFKIDENLLKSCEITEINQYNNNICSIVNYNDLLSKIITNKHGTTTFFIEYEMKSLPINTQIFCIELMIKELNKQINILNDYSEREILKKLDLFKLNIQSCHTYTQIKKLEYTINEMETDDINGLIHFYDINKYKFINKIDKISKIFKNELKYLTPIINTITQYLNEQGTDSEIKKIQNIEIKIGKMDVLLCDINVVYDDNVINRFKNWRKNIVDKKNEMESLYFKWNINQICSYFNYITNNKFKIPQNVIKKFEKIKLNGNKLNEINDSVLILCEWKNVIDRKFFLNKICDILRKYNGFKGTEFNQINKKCIICCNNNANMCSVNCGHITFCDICKGIENVEKCPICRTEIDQIVKVF